MAVILAWAAPNAVPGHGRCCHSRRWLWSICCMACMACICCNYLVQSAKSGLHCCSRATHTSSPRPLPQPARQPARQPLVVAIDQQPPLHRPAPAHPPAAALAVAAQHSTLGAAATHGAHLRQRARPSPTAPGRGKHSAAARPPRAPRSRRQRRRAARRPRRAPPGPRRCWCCPRRPRRPAPAAACPRGSAGAADARAVWAPARS
jgi:hypothetical protein